MANPSIFGFSAPSPSRMISSPGTLQREENERLAAQRAAVTRGGVGGPGGNTAANRAEEAWKTAQELLLRKGPYTPEVVQQLTNRQADQTAAIEAGNADDIRNQAAARGLDPTQALRQQQSQRQQSNVAFQGDIASQGAVQNFAAETPGRMAAAQANLQRSFTGASAPAVTGVSNTAFAPRQPEVRYTPISGIQTPAQTAQPRDLNRPTAAPAPKTAFSAPAPKTAFSSPAPVYPTSPQGAVSLAENARAYQNIYKYTN